MFLKVEKCIGVPFKNKINKKRLVAFATNRLFPTEYFIFLSRYTLAKFEYFRRK